MRRIILGAFLTAIAIGAIFFGARWVFHGRFIRETDNAYAKADTTIISAKIADRIAKVAVAENAYVHKGDPLVIIEDARWTAAEAEARAEVAARKAALDAINLEIARSDAMIADAAANVKSTESSLTVQQLDRKRYAELAKQDVATRQTLEHADAGVKNWTGKLESAKAGLEAAQAGAQITIAQREEADAALKKAEAELAIAKLNAENTIVRAPHDGVAGNIAARTGQYVTPGQRLMSLVPLHDVYIVANFKETQIGGIRPGAKVSLEFDAYPGKEIEGVVENFSPSSGSEFSLLPPENATGNFVKIVQRVPVRIRIVEAPEGVVILPGFSVTAAVDTRTGDKDADLFSPRQPVENTPMSSLAAAAHGSE